MPDISMCTNKKCELRKKCYRYTAIPDGPNGDWQAVSDFKGNEINNCFMPNAGRKNREEI